LSQLSNSLRTKRPPGPPNGWIGREHLRRVQNDLLGFSRDLLREYGDAVTYRIGPMRFYQFSHPDQISELLIDHAASLRKLQMVKWYFKRWMGRGLLLNEGEDWQRQRRKVRWSMQQLDPNRQAAMVVWQTRQLLAAHCEKEVDLAALMDRMAFYFNVRTLLGADSDDVIETIYDAANVLHATGVQELTGWNMLPDWAPTESKRRMRAALRVYRQTLLDLAAARRAAPPADADRDLLSWMIIAKDVQGKTEGMSDVRACDESVNLLMGGKETVSATLIWAAYLLALHPGEQERAAHEVREALGDREATLDDFDRLPYTQNIVQEAMRLYPPVYMIAREVARPIVVGGYRLPRRAQVHVPVYAIHRDSRWFDRPDEFLPERFDREVSLSRRPYTYIPFGVGRRNCVGKKMGYEQCVLVLATLLAEYSWRLAPSQGAPVLATDIVLHPRDPLRMVLSPRAGRRSADVVAGSAAIGT
jgi:cytochrome P450